ncbi:MAG: PHP domain-containing protein [Thermoplasmata archaeon]
MLPLIDFHIHSTFSDGLYGLNEIARYAYEKGFYAIGITDHFSTRKVRSMDTAVIKRYLEEIESIDIPLKIFKGLEIDFSPRTDISLIGGKIFEGLDYILFEYVGDISMGGYPLWKLLDIYDDIGLPIGLAHNNLQKNFSSIEMDNFLDLLETHQIFVEVNTNKNYSILGDYYYSLSDEFFKKFKDRDIPVSIGSDMHENLDEMLNVSRGINFIESLGIEENVKIFLKMLNI